MIDGRGSIAVFGGELLQHMTNRVLGVALDQAHIRCYFAKTVLLNQLLEQSYAGIVRGDLSSKIADIVLQISRATMLLIAKNIGNAIFFESPIPDEFKCHDTSPLLFDISRVRRHGARAYTANVRVMAPRRNKEENVAFIKDRRDDSN